MYGCMTHASTILAAANADLQHRPRCDRLRKPDECYVRDALRWVRASSTEPTLGETNDRDHFGGEAFRL